MSQARFFTPRTSTERAIDFVASAEVNRQLGIDCYNICVQRDQETSDMVRGVEKRCMTGCIANNLNIWMQNANRRRLWMTEKGSYSMPQKESKGVVRRRVEGRGTGRLRPS